MLELADLEVIQQSIDLGIQEEQLPTTFKLIIAKLVADIRMATRMVLSNGKAASLSSNNRVNASNEMLQASIPCLLLVKKIVIVAKCGAEKWHKNNSEERKRREDWKRDCLQNEKVKNIFQMWDSQNSVNILISHTVFFCFIEIINESIRRIPTSCK